jgi:hypothetical protein
MMAAPPYALSVHHFVSQVGDYVGFAAIVAVAIMVLLLFAHARETAELRRRAEYAEDELSLLHEQVEWLRDAQQSGGVSPGAAMPVGDVAGAGGAPEPEQLRAPPRSRPVPGLHRPQARVPPGRSPRSRHRRPLRMGARSCSALPWASAPRR